MSDKETIRHPDCPHDNTVKAVTDCLLTCNIPDCEVGKVLNVSPLDILLKGWRVMDNNDLQEKIHLSILLFGCAVIVRDGDKPPVVDMKPWEYKLIRMDGDG